MTDSRPTTMTSLSLVTPAGVRIAYDRFGTGPALVLVHGSFCDHRTNWQFVAPELARHFTLYAIARRGRGGTEVTEWHSVEDEAGDVAALIEAIDDRVYLLGHSYGAQVALAAASLARERITKLVLYEPPVTDIVTQDCNAALDDRAAVEDWEGYTVTFMRRVVSLSESELAAMRASPLWPEFVSEARATCRDISALLAYDFDLARFARLPMPVMLQIGTESRRESWVTDPLAAVLPDVRIAELPGQGHDAMFTAPDLYARQVIDLLRR